MGNTQYDYPMIRAWYIAQPGDRPSARSVAEKFGITSHSTLFARMQREEWEVDRLAVIAEAREKQIAISSTQVASKLSQINADLLDLTRSAILKMGIDMEDRWETDPESGARQYVQGRPVDARGITLLIEKVMALNGMNAGKGDAGSVNLHLHKHLGGDAEPTVPLSLARELLDRAEREGAGAERMGRSALPRAEDARQIEGGVAVTVGR